MSNPRTIKPASNEMSIYNPDGGNMQPEGSRERTRDHIGVALYAVGEYFKLTVYCRGIK